jgi:hypothetical protein
MISETDLRWWCSLNNCRALRDIKSVCDLGLQQLMAVRRDDYDVTTERFVALCGEPEVSLTDCHSSADMWRRLKREIISLDLVGADPSLVEFDLNTDRVPEHLRNHFDLVTNVGTTEHVFNQLNCFTVLHDLTKINGIMAHAVPSTGFKTHGLYTYPLKFFWRLAYANDYECLDAWMSLDPEDKQAKPNVGEYLRDESKTFRNARTGDQHPIAYYHLSFDDYRSSDSCLYVFLRKTSSAAFRLPVDMPDG